MLVIMDRDDYKETKVVRYAGSTEKQIKQFSENGDSLYSSGTYPKYIKENGNSDIFVSDNAARAVVVANHSGKLSFKYTGPPYFTKNHLIGFGITIDSMNRILEADFNNQHVHILNEDGNFLHYISICDLRYPWGLCVDTKDYLFVAECCTGKVKKIQYYI